MIKGLAHVCLSTMDLAATERFYGGALELKKAFDFIREGQVVGHYFELPRNGFIEVFKRDAVEVAANHPIAHFCLEVEDLDVVVARLAGQGYEVTTKKLGADSSWQAWTKDPSGVRIEFHQYTGQSSQITRRDCVLS